jgi:hypothetical protein
MKRGCRRAVLQHQDENFPRLAHAAQRVAADQFEPAGITGRCSEFRGHQHLAAERLAQSRNARGLVDGRADHGEVQPVHSADIAIQNFAAVQGEIDRRGWLAGFAPPCSESVERRHRPAGGIERKTTDLVLRQLLERQDGEHPVAEEFEHLGGRADAMQHTFWSLRKSEGALWRPSYFVGSVGGAPMEMLRQSIENQGRSEPPA